MRTALSISIIAGILIFSNCTPNNKSNSSATIPPVVLHIEQAGSLCDFIADSKIKQISSLTLTGNLNFYDASCVRAMEGLSFLDLSNANITGDRFMEERCLDEFLSSNLYSIAIPDNGFFSSNAFKDYHSLRLIEIIVSENNKLYSFVDGVLFDKNKTTLIRFLKEGTSSYVIPNCVKEIKNYAFRYSRNLTKLTLPEDISKIEDYAFEFCEKLIELHIKNPTPIPLKSYVFDYEVRNNCILYVPKGSYNAYWLAPGWGDFKHIVEE